MIWSPEARLLRFIMRLFILLPHRHLLCATRRMDVPITFGFLFLVRRCSFVFQRGVHPIGVPWEVILKRYMY